MPYTANGYSEPNTVQMEMLQTGDPDWLSVEITKSHLLIIFWMKHLPQ